MYFVKTPWYLKSVYPSLTWDIPAPKTLYITFDDGPVAGVTDEVLEMLAEYNAKATFFCIGDNVNKSPALFDRIRSAGHTVGNHTFHHLNGWKTENDIYFEDVRLCSEAVASQLFRPPYGRIGYHQIQELKKTYRIMMWDVLSGDFDTTISSKECTQNVIHHAEEGSIVVFHDSEKAKPRLLESLPVVLEHFSKKGFVFNAIPVEA